LLVVVLVNLQRAPLADETDDGGHDGADDEQQAQVRRDRHRHEGRERPSDCCGAGISSTVEPESARRLTAIQRSRLPSGFAATLGDGARTAASASMYP
jgi:hypothetical protein